MIVYRELGVKRVSLYLNLTPGSMMKVASYENDSYGPHVRWLAIQIFLCVTRSQARSSNQADSTGKSTGDVVENLRATVRDLEDIFVRVTV